MNFNDKPTLVCQTKDDLKKLNSNYGAVCLDDWDEELAGLGGAQVTQLFDRFRTVSIRCRYTDAVIEKGVPMIVCSNNDMNWVKNIHPGVDRRVTLVRVEAWDMAQRIAEAAERRIAELKEEEHDGKHDDSDNKMEEFQLEIEAALNEDAEDEDFMPPPPSPPQLQRANAETNWTQMSSSSLGKRKRTEGVQVWPD